MRTRMSGGVGGGRLARPPISICFGIAPFDHLFGSGKVPVRGKPRIGVVVVGSAAMSNMPRIYRCVLSRPIDKLLLV